MEIINHCFLISVESMSEKTIRYHSGFDYVRRFENEERLSRIHRTVLLCSDGIFGRI